MQNLAKKKTSGKKKVKPEQAISKPEEKYLDNKKILIFTALAAVIVIVVLVISGVLDSENTVTVNTPNQNNQSPGVSLQNLQQINDLEAKVKANPDDMQSLLQLANLRFDSGLFEKAIPDYKQYLAKVPSDANARIDMGVCYYNTGDLQNAINEMEKALEYKPNHQIGALNLGIVNLSAGNVDKAKEWFRKAVAIDPNSKTGIKAQELLNSHN